MDTALNDAISEQIATRIDTLAKLETLNWYQSLPEDMQAVCRKVLFIGLPAHYDDRVEEALIALMGLLTGYELLMTAASAAVET